jgi:hypothetical protein
MSEHEILDEICDWYYDGIAGAESSWAGAEPRISPEKLAAFLSAHYQPNT